MFVGVAALVAAAVFPLIGPPGSPPSDSDGLRAHLSHLLAVAPAAAADPTTLPRTGWTVVADSEETVGENGRATNAIDGSASTFWHTQWYTATSPLPHTITIDMHATQYVSGLTYLPRPVGNRNGNIGRYQVGVSTNGTTWTQVATGTFADDSNRKTVTWAAGDTRFVRLTAQSEAGNRGQWSNAAELNLLTLPVTPTPTATATTPPPSATATATVTATATSSPPPAGSGRWSPVINFPLVPGAAAQLPNGKILTWSAYLPYDWSGNWNGIGRTQTATYDPATNTVSARTVTETGHDMFCPGTATLPDGRLVVTGGTVAGVTSIYDPSTNTWTRAQNMQITRGYQGSTTLSDGRVFVLGGSWNGGRGGKDGEVWSQAAGWRRLSGVPVWPILTKDPAGVYRADNHGWFFSWTGQRVFHAGPSRQMNWISTVGNGSVTAAGNRADDADAMNGFAAMYDVGKILTFGGAPAYDNASPATKSAFVIDINNGATARRVSSMANARTFANGVVLPDGKVLVTGGQAFARGFEDTASVYTPELWDPATEQFTTLAPAVVPRNYHAVALLLTDGRVLVGGGGMCGNCTTNHPDAEIFTPPYLLNPDGTARSRPVITASPATAPAGSSISVTTDREATSFSIVRLGAVTHDVNNDQRRIPLTPTSTDGTTYTLPIPADRGIALPGNYMLFAMDSNGVPSISKIIKVT